MVWWNIYIVVFVVAALLSLMLTPMFRQLAVTLDFFDRPAIQDHKRHGEATPLLGGLAIFTAWALTIALGALVPFLLSTNKFVPTSLKSFLGGLLQVSTPLIVLVVGAALAVILGLYDDKRNMSAKAKLLWQFVIAALVASWGDVKISFFISNAFINWSLTVFWIMFIMNAVNFFDNMDGLAVGVAAIAFSFFTIAAACFGHYFVACLGAAGAGAAIGFWFYNHSPATIFMGDSGSQFLGYSLAVMGALTTYYQQGETFSHLAVLVPVFILAMPIFDLLAVVVIRTKQGKPIYIGDNNHISHRFANMGMSRKHAVLAVHLLALIIGLSALPLMWGDERTTIVCMVQTGCVLLFVTLIQFTATKK